MLVGCLAGQAAEPEVTPRDTLVYKDGDRVQGRLVEQKDSIIIFQSDRFGQLRVPAAEAVVIPASRPAGSAPVPAVVAGTPVAPPPAKPAGPAPKPDAKAAQRAEEERLSLWEHFSPAVLTAGLRNFFGPWHGKFAFTTETVSNAAHQTDTGLEMQLKRKWKSDEVQLNAHYDFSQTNDLATTDMIKADGLWRHDFPQDRFMLYRPSLEWNRANFINGVPADYVLLQQEIGVGLSLLTKPARKVRVGVSENLFDVWNTSLVQTHSSRAVESVFVETELKLPWGMLLSGRGVYYYALSTKTDGWENRAELAKKFSETLSTALRYEYRRNSPDGRAQDYTRLKLLFGLDF